MAGAVGFRLIVLATIASLLHGFGFPTRMPWKTAQHRLNKEEPKNDNDEYFKRLVEASRDPVAFEKFVMAKGDQGNEPSKPSASFSEQTKETAAAPSKGYQRIEEWDAQRTKNGTSWEERVQFDGQRYGNQFQQNEILRKNLKVF